MVLSRVYVGRIPNHSTERDIEDMFKEYGRIKDIAIKSGFCFVDYTDHRDAQDAVKECDGRRFLGERIRVEMAKGTPHGMDYQKDIERGVRLSPSRSRPRNSYDRPRGSFNRRAPTPKNENRMIVRNLSTRVSWQDLKDFMRKYGEIIYTDAHKQKEREGCMKSAIKELQGYEMNGRAIQLEALEVSRSRSASRSLSRSRRTNSRSKSRSRSRSRARKSKSGSRDKCRKSRSASRDRSHKSRSASRDRSRRSASHDRSRSRSDSASPVCRNGTSASPQKNGKERERSYSKSD